MPTTLAVEQLYARVVQRFTDDESPIASLFGWRTPAHHVEGNRVAWVPGDPSGRVGTTTGPRNPGRNPRPLSTLRELFTVYISGADDSDPDNEFKQYKAARHIYDLWFRAVYLAAHGTFAIREIAWLDTRKERRHGAAMRVVLELEAAILDVAHDVAPADVSAVLTNKLDDSADPPINVAAPEDP